MTTLRQKILDVIKIIPKGNVSTYKNIAQMVGTGPRVVGKIIHQNLDPQTYPCHRVVKNNGQLATGYAFGGKVVQRQRLEAEGVQFINDRIDLSQYQYCFDAPELAKCGL